MKEIQIAIAIRKRKYLLLLSGLVVFSIAFLVQLFFTYKFRSEVRFIVNEGDVINLNVPEEFKTDVTQASTSGMNRMYLFLHSTACMDYMIDKFKLYEHYHVNRNQRFAYEQVIERLTGNISLSLLGKHQNVMVLSVMDKDRMTAAYMANAFIDKLHQMNNKFLENQLKRKVFIYNLLYEDIKKEMDDQKQQLTSLVIKYSELVNQLERRHIDVEQMKMSLAKFSGSFEARQQEMLKVRQLYMLMSNAIENENFESISLMNKALPDTHSPYIKTLAISTFITLGFMVVTFLFAWIYYENRELIRAILFAGN